MLKWIQTYIQYVEKHPLNFNRDVRDNVRQIKELLSRKSIVYKEADPIAFEQFCRLFKHREGVLSGKPIILNMEQRYIAGCILGIKEWSNEYNCYVRYFNEMDLFVARKWGKDHFVAPLICYFLGLDKEPSAWGQIVAENSSQSLRTFEIVEKEIKKEPLNQVFKKVGSKEKKQILCSINDGKLEYLSGRIKGKDGSNPSFAVANEIHEITNFNQYNALKSGMGARKQPMMLVISSAGITPESLYESLLERNRKFLRKLKLGKTDRIFALMYGIDDDDDIEDESCWIKANPAMYEGRPTLKFLQEQWQQMKDDPIMRNTFISKHLNRQIGASVNYYSLPDIKNCMMQEITKDQIYDTYATGGVDLSSTTDLCNATAKILGKNGITYIVQAYFLPSDCVDKNSEKDKRDYRSMTYVSGENEITQRLMIITNSTTVDYHYVTQWFVTLRDEYKVSFLKIGYDKAMSNYWIADMVENGFTHEVVKFDKDNRVESRDDGILTPCYQGVGLDPAIRMSKTLFELGKYVIDKNNVLLPYCFWNVSVKNNNDNKLSVSKAKSTGHIDGCIGVFNSEIAYIRAKEIYQDAIPEYFEI